MSHFPFLDEVICNRRKLSRLLVYLSTLDHIRMANGHFTANNINSINEGRSNPHKAEQQMVSTLKREKDKGKRKKKGILEIDMNRYKIFSLFISFLNPLN